jgi:hypothetical protein
MRCIWRTAAQLGGTSRVEPTEVKREPVCVRCWRADLAEPVAHALFVADRSEG